MCAAVDDREAPVRQQRRGPLAPRLRRERVALTAHDERRRLHEWQAILHPVMQREVGGSCEPQRAHPRVVAGDDPPQRLPLAQRIDGEAAGLERVRPSAWIDGGADEDERAHALRMVNRQLDGDLAAE